MNVESTTGVHWSFWIITALALVWNILGGVNFFMQMDADIVSAMPDTHRAIIIGRPVWATAGFAVIVFGGALGCLLLLLRKSTAYHVFIVSLLGGVVTMIHTVNIARLTIDFSASEIVVMIMMPLVVTAFLVWYAKWAQRQSWIS
jgi:hypothetical protein